MKTLHATKSYYAGYDAKVKEIQGMGFEAARDKLNLDYPPGEKYQVSADGFYYMHGEADALADIIK